jgi:kynurenine formamidase
VSESFRFVEVSHVVEPGMSTYPGLPVPEAEVFLDYEESAPHYEGKAEFLIASLHLCGNTGTYVDSPVHRHRGGVDLAGLPLGRLAHLPVTLVDATAAPSLALGPELFRGVEIRGRAVLVRTDWSRHWRTERYFDPNPHLTGDACDLLLDAGVRFVGIDSLNVDAVSDPARPAHTKLLGAGVPVCEHLTNLAAVPARGGRLHAVPIAWKGGATFPVRAYVMTED